MFLLGYFAFVPVVISCSKDNGSSPKWEWHDTDTEVLSDSVVTARGWTLQTDFGDLPSYIRIYKSPAKLQGKKAIAYIAVASIDSVTFSVLGNSKGYTTPSEFYKLKKSAVILNAGYFWDGSSLSLLCRNGDVLCPNNQVEYRSDNTVFYYPTRGVFGLMTDGRYDVDWVYTSNAVTYAYSFPANNKSGETPLEMPSSTFPEEASVWSGLTAVGGGPVLIKDSLYVNSYTEELFDSESGIGPEINNPRSAIGVTSDRKLLFFVCEGRKMTEGVNGLTLEDETNLLLSLGCVQALNLDGGGSSCMLINGVETIKPSDGKQRSVVTAVALN